MKSTSIAGCSCPEIGASHQPAGAFIHEWRHNIWILEVHERGATQMPRAHVEHLENCRKNLARPERKNRNSSIPVVGAGIHFVLATGRLNTWTQRRWEGSRLRGRGMREKIEPQNPMGGRSGNPHRCWILKTKSYTYTIITKMASIPSIDRLKGAAMQNGAK